MPTGIYERTEYHKLNLRGIKRSAKAKQNISKGRIEYFANMSHKERVNITEIFQKAGTRAGQTLEGRQKNSKAQTKQWVETPKEKRSDRLRHWIETGNKAMKEKRINMTKEERLEATKLLRKAAYEKRDKMSKKERKGYFRHWVEAGQRAAQKANPSSIEKAIWKELDKLSIEYKTQISFNNGKFIVDIYIPTQRLIIECNGDYWHNLPQRKERDKKLKKYAMSNNYRLIELWEHDIRIDPKQVLQAKIKMLNLKGGI